MLPGIRKTLGGLKFVSKQIPTASRVILANGLILSRIQYAMALWGGTKDNNIRRIQATLNRVARWATNSSKHVRTVELMKKMWLEYCERNDRNDRNDSNLGTMENYMDESTKTGGETDNLD